MIKINFVNNSSPLLSAENLNQMQNNTENAINDIIKNDYISTNNATYNCNYINNDLIKIFSVNFGTGAVSSNADLYDQTKTITTTEIPSTYKPIGIVGEDKTGGYYSHCPFTRLYIGGNNNRTLYWALKNTSNTNISNLNVTIYILAIKIST